MIYLNTAAHPMRLLPLSIVYHNVVVLVFLVIVVTLACYSSGSSCLGGCGKYHIHHEIQQLLAKIKISVYN